MASSSASPSLSPTSTEGDASLAHPSKKKKSPRGRADQQTSTGACARQGGAQPKPCHNCRRQRLRCDRSYPQCRKCTSAGKECLGYGKLLTWTGAIASRGKHKGRTSLAVDAPTAQATLLGGPAQSHPIDATLMSSAPRGTATAMTTATGAASANTAATTTTATATTAAATADGLCPIDAGSAPGVGEVLDQLELVTCGDAAAAAAAAIAAGTTSLTAARNLTDPILQGLSTKHRFYLSYFTNRFCQDLVSHDTLESNPFRSLVPLTREHPMLQSVIIAACASHLSTLYKSALPSGEKTNEVVPWSRQRASEVALSDALVAKQQALRLMPDALKNIDSVGVDVVLATALFFVNVELLESGKNNWRAHLEGACNIMSLAQKTAAIDDALRDYLLSDCFSYYILASTLMPAAHAAAFKLDASQMRSVLAKTKTNTYLCCPPEILEILHEASQLSNADPEASSVDEITKAGVSLLERTQRVNIEDWAKSGPGNPDAKNEGDAPSDARLNAGWGHKLTTCLYILQAVPHVSDNFDPKLSRDLCRKLYVHLSSIPEDDPNFKATSWPAFILGADSDDIGMRIWAANRLRRIVAKCPWGFIFTAIDTLQLIWDLRDNYHGAGNYSWVQDLKEPSLNFLIV